MAVRIIEIQGMDGKWYNQEVADLIDPLDDAYRLRIENVTLNKFIDETDNREAFTEWCNCNDGEVE